jgi:hypothetical protein
MKFIISLVFSIFLTIITLNQVKSRETKIGPERNKRDCEENGFDWSPYGCLKGFKRIEGNAEEVQRKLELEARRYYRKLRKDEKKKRRLAREQSQN